jgi:membrane-associated phospholipid phosphatase
MQLAKILDNNTFLLVLVAIVLLLYFVTDRPFGQTHIVKIGLDAHIPLVPAFSVPYLLFLPALVGTIIYAYVSKMNFKALALSIIIVYLFSYLVYLLYQTYVPRPAITGHDIFSNLVRWIYGHDQPYNGMPSTHASGAMILAVYYLMTYARWGWVVAIFSFLVVLSTLFVKQHFVLDAITGVTLGLIVGLLSFKYLTN